VPPVEHPTSVREAPVRLACIGRLVPQKGFDLAIRAMPEVLAHHPHVRMSIVGGGPDGRALVELARELGVEKNIDFEGIVDRDRVASLLTECRAVVMPSRFEGLPLVALEAGWAARPVVGATAPGLSEAIFDGDNAITVPMEDPPALARAIERLVEDRDLAERLGCRGRERAERDHSLVTCADAYERLYEKVVSSA
jgi:glycosyltransferase involved in cell wall biosynthesis